MKKVLPIIVYSIIAQPSWADSIICAHPTTPEQVGFCEAMPEWAHGFDFANPQINNVVLFGLRGGSSHAREALQRLAALSGSDQARIAGLYYSYEGEEGVSPEDLELVQELRVPQALIETAIAEARAGGVSESRQRALRIVFEDLRNFSRSTPGRLRALERYAPVAASRTPAAGLLNHLLAEGEILQAALADSEAALAESEAALQQSQRRLEAARSAVEAGERAMKLLAERFGSSE